MLPETHHGAWAGVNRLWMEDPQNPERSPGRVTVESTVVRYEWAFQGAPQAGQITLTGPGAAVHATWKDTFHASDGMELYGPLHSGLLRLYGTYSVDGSPEWGWIIEFDFRDPEYALLRMFNVPEGRDPVIAVDLHAARA